MSQRDGKAFARVAAHYARDVVAGRILACQYVVLACTRHLEGLRQQRTRAYPYKLDEKAIQSVCRFVELLPHVKGKWARDNERLTLEPWQVFTLANVFGWKRKRDNLRRFRRVYIEVPRKNAKSTLTAAAGNYMLVADGEHGAEVYSGATSEKQAWEVFGPARLMAQKTPALLEAYGVNVGAKNLHVINTASKFEPIIGKPGDGASPSFSVTDEYHEHATSEQYDTMLTGMGAREQPIAWVITTAGSDTSGPCYALRQQSTDMLEGKVEYDDLFALIYTIDPEDDWTAPSSIRKANPNLGVSVSEEFLLTAQQRAVSDPREASTFKTKHLCQWVTAAAPYFNAQTWNSLADPNLREDQFAGEPCFVALDLASTQDIAATVKLFRREIAGVEHYYTFGRFYCPEVITEAPERQAYAGWVKAGYLIATPGDITDYDYIESDIKADATKYQVQQIGYDKWDASQVVTHLQAFLGADKVVQIPQTTEFLSHPMKHIAGMIDAGRIHHTGNPVFGWMIGNVTAQVDRNDNVFPRKERADRKIDGAVALIVATNCALREPVPDTSTWLVGAV